MDPPKEEVTHNCERFCKIPCSDFTANSPLNKDCLAAVIHCKCHPIWKQPLFWLIFGIVFAIVVTVVRAIYMYLKDKKAKKAASTAVNSSQGIKNLRYKRLRETKYYKNSP
ncbi:unnamed protein product [Orchesella dallaii]|uniref:Uncharacterized protein n=1 Tax=Orchesella dallaii TaxID=48710 RepID=A0ABP1S8H1_9HEXA